MEKNNKKLLSPDEVFVKLKEYFSGDRKLIFILTFLAGMFIHFLLLGSLIQSQDGLMHALHYTASGYETSLGRWGIDIFDSVRYDLALPFITTTISMILLAFTNIFIIDLLEIKSRLLKILTTLIFVVSPSLCMTLLYVYTADVYFWSMFLSVLTVYGFYKIKNKKIGVIIGIISFIFALSTYQSYMGMTIGLIVMYNIKRLLTEKNSLKEVFLDLVKKAVLLIVAAILYYIITLVLIAINDLKMTSYGGFNEITVGTIFASIISSIKNAYMGFIKYYFADGIILNRTWGRDKLYIVFFVLLITVILKLLIQKIKEEKDVSENKKISKEFIFRILFLSVLGICLPIFLNIVCLIAPGNEIYYLTSTQLVLMIPFMFMLFELLDINKVINNLLNWAMVIVVILIIITYAFSIIVTYQTLEISYNQAISVANRVLEEIEDVPGYRTGMNYMFAGVVDDINFPKVLDIYNFALTDSLRGSIFHGVYWGQEATWRNFMNIFTGLNFNQCEDYEYYLIMNSEEFKEMNIFPGDNSVKMINDVMVVKFTDTPDKPPYSSSMKEWGIEKY